MRLDYKWRASMIAGIALFLSVLDNTIVAVALPRMREYFHSTVTSVNWVAIAYFLAQAAAIPVTGYFVDRLGTKRVFLAALTGFLIGSAFCVVAPREGWLIAARVLQGLGGGAIFPVGFTIVYRAFPAVERINATTVIGGPVLLAPALGPTLGGYLTTAFDWPAIFFINLPVGGIALVLAAVFLRNHGTEFTAQDRSSQASGHLDLLGLLLSMSAFTLFVLALTLLGQWGVTDAWALGLLGLSLLLVTSFVLVELNVEDPVMDLRLFLSFTFSISTVLMCLLSVFVIGSLFLIPYFLVNVTGYSALAVGYSLLSLGVTTGLGAALSGVLYKRFGPRTVITFGFLLLVLSSCALTRLTVSTTGLSLQLWLSLRGLGFGLTLVPLQTLAFAVVEEGALARATSLLNVLRQVFSALGVALLTALLATQTRHYQNAESTHVLCSRLGPDPSHCIWRHATTMGLNESFLWVALATGACMLAGLFVGRDPVLEEARRNETERQKGGCAATLSASV